MNREDRAKRDKEIVAMRRDRLSIAQIAERLNMSKSGVERICKVNGVAGVMSGRKANVTPGNQYTRGNYDQIANAKRYIEKSGRFTYVDGFTGVDGFANVRCKKCGTVMRKSMVTFRHSKNSRCDECDRREREARKERKAEKDEQQKRLKKFSNIERNQMEICVCKECGKLAFYTTRRRFCSKDCGDRFWDRQRKDKRTRKMQDGDRDITLKDLYQRDDGVCNGCGIVCDWNDFVMDGDNFIAGDNYPSIDHIMPLSKGGRHTWSNVQLMCRRCNYLKRDAMPLIV